MQHRNDIQGLRAIAVILVILNHLQFSNKAFVGGFVGVDVFFVISGYIITSLLIREYSKNARDNSGYGWISLRAFYFRRVKRIIPAATFVILATVTTSYFLFNDIKAGWIKRDGFFASIFLANINLIQQKTDYFKQSISQSPLEHYWSLSVEEQFYFVIPFLILISVSFHGLKIGKVNLWWERRVMALLSFVGVISFLWSLYATSTNPQSAYFSTFARAWEIAAGSLLALYAFQIHKDISKKVANIVGVLGLIGILISSFIFNGSSRFPGYLALLPVLSTVALIYSGGAHSNSITSRLLSQKPLVFIGEISFSLYLWHLPLIVIGRDVFKITNNPGIIKFILVILTLLLAIFSYKFIETPFRNITVPQAWIMRSQNHNLIQLKLNVLFSNSKFRKSIVLIASLALFAFCYSFVSKVVYAKPVSNSLIVSNSSNFSTDGQDSQGKDQTQDLTNSSPQATNSSWSKKIADGLFLPTLPSNIQSNLSELTQDRAFSSASCSLVESIDFQAESNASVCPVGKRSLPLALFIGNSHGAMLQDSMAKVLNDLGYSEEGIFTSSCTISPKVIPLLNSSPVSKCKNFGEDLSRYVKKRKPTLIVISQAFNESLLSVQNQIAVQDSVKNFKKIASKIVILDAFPEFPSISTCISKSGELRNCKTSLKSTDIYRAINKDISRNSGANLISPISWMCYQGRCPAVIEGVLVSPDGSHLTPQFADSIVPLLKEQLSSTLTTSPKVKNSQNSTIQSIADDNNAKQKYLVDLKMWRGKITSSVGQFSTKKLSPPFKDTAGKDVFANPDCKTSFSISALSIKNFNPCVVRGGGKTAVFIGNSHARMLQSTVAEGLKNNGFSTYSISKGSCIIAEITPVVNGIPTKDCQEFRAAAVGLVTQLQPDLIVISEALGNSSTNFLPSGIQDVKGISHDSAKFWIEYLKGFSKIKTSVSKLVVIGESPHLNSNPVDCVNSLGDLSSACQGIPVDIESVVDTQKKMVKKIGGEFLDLRDWLCTTTVCPAIIDNTLAYTDMSHLSFPIQRKLLPIFEALILSWGL